MSTVPAPPLSGETIRELREALAKVEATAPADMVPTHEHVEAFRWWSMLIRDHGPALLAEITASRDAAQAIASLPADGGGEMSAEAPPLASGAEAMREACAQLIEQWPVGLGDEARRMFGKAIRRLPLPEHAPPAPLVSEALREIQKQLSSIGRYHILHCSFSKESATALLAALAPPRSPAEGGPEGG